MYLAKTEHAFAYLGSDDRRATYDSYTCIRYWGLGLALTPSVTGFLSELTLFPTIVFEQSRRQGSALHRDHEYGDTEDVRKCKKQLERYLRCHYHHVKSQRVDGREFKSLPAHTLLGSKRLS